MTIGPLCGVDLYNNNSTNIICMGVMKTHLGIPGAVKCFSGGQE